MRNRRLIDYVRHDLMSRQALDILLRCWGEDRRIPVILIAPRGTAADIVRTIRVALSKERKKQPAENRAYYGFHSSDVFPYTVDGVKNEAVLLRWRITAMQNIRNTFRTADDLFGKKEGESENGG